MRWFLLACALAISGCGGNSGTFPLYVSNMSNALLTARGAQPMTVTIAPGGHTKLDVSRDEGAVVTFEGAAGTDQVKVGEGVLQGTGATILHVYGAPPFPLWTADATAVYGDKVPPELTEVKLLGEGKTFEFAENMALILPGEGSPQLARKGAPVTEIMLIPRAIQDAKMASDYMLREIKLKLKARLIKSLPPAPRR